MSRLSALLSVLPMAEVDTPDNTNGDGSDDTPTPSDGSSQPSGSPNPDPDSSASHASFSAVVMIGALTFTSWALN